MFTESTAHPPLGASGAREPSACTVITSPSDPQLKSISSALAVIVQEAISLGCNAESAVVPCAAVAKSLALLPESLINLPVVVS